MDLKKLMVVLVIGLLMISTFGNAAAQSSSTTPSASPSPTEGGEGSGSLYFTHPVISVLSAYFGRESAPQAVSTGTPTVTATPGTEGTGETIGEQIAAYHEDGLGFGVLVKLFAMAEESITRCGGTAAAGAAPSASATPVCSVVSVEELISAFKSGTGLGQLFKEYAKPTLLGVGQVRKEAGKLEVTSGGMAQPTPQVSGTPQPKGNGKPETNPGASKSSTRVPKVKPNHK